ncbi:MAG: hypothetical protein ACYC6Y_16245 [Thermoguttaceae bacterium]
MNDSRLDESVRARMQQLRCEIDDDMEDIAASARTKLDWKHYVKTYPWTCLGAAVALGFLAVPKRSRVIRPDVATLAELETTGHLGVKPASSATHGLIDSLWAAVANIAIRNATAYLGQTAGRYLGIADHPWTSRHDSNCMP